jgi:hypothetical protein
LSWDWRIGCGEIKKIETESSIKTKVINKGNWNKSLLLSGPSCSLLSPQLMGKLLTDACRCRLAPGSWASSGESSSDSSTSLGASALELVSAFPRWELGQQIQTIQIEKFQGKIAAS